jgi:hypothetical protein
MAVPNYSRFAFTVPEVLSSKMECKFKHVEKSMARRPVGECAAVHAGRVTDDETVHGVVFTKELKF